VQIMAVKVFPASGGGSGVGHCARVDYATSRVAPGLSSASYGAIGNTGFSNTELAAITAARDAGVIFVAAAGNAGANMDVSAFLSGKHTPSIILSRSATRPAATNSRSPPTTEPRSICLPRV
jgi:subtilisin family serine protease